MTPRDGVFPSALCMLMPFETEYKEQDSQKQWIGRGGKTYVMVAPDGMEAVPVVLPVRPLTLQVRSLDVTSVTGLLLGGMRR